MNEQLKALIDKAKAALAIGNVEEATTLRKQAETLKASLAELDALNSFENSTKAAPVAPNIPLPGTSGGSFVQVPTQANDSQKAANTAEERATAAYQMRFSGAGDDKVDGAIKSILVDLHGANYQQLYWEQRKAFNTYIRRGDRELSNQDYRLLKSIVFTPTAIKDAISQGVDDISSFKAAMVEAVDTLGGFAVPVDFQNRILERIAGFAVVRSSGAFVGQTSSDMVEVTTSTGGDDQYSSAVRVRWSKELPTAGANETNLTFGLESLPIHTMLATAPISRNNVEDAAFNVESYLVTKIGEAAAMEEDNKFLAGVGAGTPQGILPGGTNALGLTEVVSGHATLLTWDGLIGLSLAVPTQYRNGACWVMERATITAIAKLKGADNAYLWNPFQYAGGAENVPMRLLGYPVKEQEVMPSIGAGTYPILFGNFGGYSIYDRVGLTVERYLDSATAEINQIKYVMRRRVGGQLTESFKMAVCKVAAS